MNKQDEYKKRLKIKLLEWQLKIDQLEAKAKEGKEEVSEEIRSELDKLTQKKEVMESKIAAFSDTSLEKWEEFKKSSDEGLDDLSHAVDGAYKKVKKFLSGE